VHHLVVACREQIVAETHRLLLLALVGRGEGFENVQPVARLKRAHTRALSLACLLPVFQRKEEIWLNCLEGPPVGGLRNGIIATRVSVRAPPIFCLDVLRFAVGDRPPFDRSEDRPRGGSFSPSGSPSGSSWEARWSNTIVTNSSAESFSRPSELYLIDVS